MKINKEDLSILVIEEDSIDMYIEFISKIKKTIDRQEFLGDFSKEELLDILKKKGYVFLFKYEEDIVSCSMLIRAEEKDLEEFNLDINYKELVELGPQAVLKEYRGNKIQDYMIKRMIKLSKDLGFKHMITSAHPDNIYSINNFKKNHFKKIATKEYKRGIRNIYYKDI